MASAGLRALASAVASRSRICLQKTHFRSLTCQKFTQSAASLLKSRRIPGLVRRYRIMRDQGRKSDYEKRIDEEEWKIQVALNEGLIVQPDRYTKLVKMLSDRRYMSRAEYWMQIMMDHWVDPGINLFNIIINGHCKAGNLIAAYRWMNVLKAKGHEPTEYTYTAFLRNYAYSGKLDKAEEMMEKLKALGLADATAYFLLLKAYIRAKDMDKFEVALNSMQASTATLDSKMCSQLLVDMGKATGDITTSFDYLRSTMHVFPPVDVDFFNAALKHLGRSHQITKSGRKYIPEKAYEMCLALVSLMEKFEVEYDIHLCNELVRIASLARQQQGVLQWSHRARQFSTNGSIENHFEHLSSFEDAREANKELQKLRRSEVSVNASCYEAVMRLFAVKGDWESINELLRQMMADDVFPTSSTFSSMLNCLSRRGATGDKAREVLKYMRAYNIKMTPRLCGAFINAILRVEGVVGIDLDFAKEVIQEMVQEKRLADSKLYDTILDLLTKVGEYKEAKTWADAKSRQYPLTTRNYKQLIHGAALSWVRRRLYNEARRRKVDSDSPTATASVFKVLDQMRNAGYDVSFPGVFQAATPYQIPRLRTNNKWKTEFPVSSPGLLDYDYVMDIALAIFGPTFVGMNQKCFDRLLYATKFIKDTKERAEKVEDTVTRMEFLYIPLSSKQLSLLRTLPSRLPMTQKALDRASLARAEGTEKELSMQSSSSKTSRKSTLLDDPVEHQLYLNNVGRNKKLPKYSGPLSKSGKKLPLGLYARHTKTRRQSVRNGTALTGESDESSRN